MKTKISRPGNENGFALLIVLVIMFLCSFAFIALAQHATIKSREASRAMAAALGEIQKENEAIGNRYEFD
jgi:hypothetical protein